MFLAFYSLPNNKQNAQIVTLLIHTDSNTPTVYFIHSYYFHRQCLRCRRRCYIITTARRGSPARCVQLDTFVSSSGKRDVQTPDTQKLRGKLPGLEEFRNRELFIQAAHTDSAVSFRL